MNITKELLIEHLKTKSLHFFNSYYKGYMEAIKDIIEYKELESTSEWVELDSYKDADGFILYDYRCSNCSWEVQDLGDKYEAYELYCYCPHCGIKMKLPSEQI